jgi:pSer/pThr/pTyr-binding forkhead associated (FHA) protein
MYKIVAVGGKLRGQEFILKDGENIIGRSSDVDYPLAVEGVSKRHMSITVNGDTAFIEDLGSSNGTFVNGKLIKKMTVKNQDKIALPNVIFQLVHVKEKKIVVKKKVAKVQDSQEETQSLSDEPMPEGPLSKLRHLFKHKIMPILYGFNESYEWRVLIGIILFIFIAINISLVITPVLKTSNQILDREIELRGESYADEVARANNTELSRKNFDRIDTSFLEKVPDIVSYELFDLEGRIIRPVTKQNSYINDPFSVYVKNEISSKLESGISKLPVKTLGEGERGIGRAIKAYDSRTGREEAVGFISIRFAPRSLGLAASNNLKSYLEALTTSALVAVIFFGMFYYLSTRPIEEMKMQIENVLRGKQKELESKLLMEEVRPLRNSINSILQRMRELQSNESGEFAEVEDDAPYLRTLEEFIRGAMGPALILNQDKIIHVINSEGEDLTGLREASSKGSSLLDSLRDQGFAATVIDLCDKSATNSGCNQQETYDISGRAHQINVVSLLGKDTFPKGFYVTFLKE